MKHKNNRLWNYLLMFFFIIIFIPTVIVIMPFVIINDLVFGTFKGWNYNYIIFKYSFLFDYFFIGIKNQVFYESEHDTTKKYVFVTNHISFLDIPEMLINVKQPVRILGKKGPDKIPVFGYYYRKSTVMVDRSSTESRIKSLNKLKHFLNNGISILICPEGTFNMTTNPLKEFYDGAFRIAIETQTNIKPILLLDTFNTLNSLGFGLQNGKSRAIYLQEINVQGMQINDVSQLKSLVYNIMEDGLKRYNAAWIKN